MDETITITLKENSMERLREIAHYHGYILDRSQRKGEGSIRQMLKAVADGDLVIYPAMVKTHANN
jgi:hypothetical protein